MARKGPRPHVWLIKDELLRSQHLAWLRMKAQAVYRKEDFELTFEDFLNLWTNMWEHRGRHPENYCLTRDDPDGAWDTKNTILVNRREHLQQQAKEKGGRFGRNAKCKSN